MRVAQRAALSVYGVQAVANDLVVTQTPPRGCSDTDIAQAAVAALRCSTVPHDRIAITVSDGWVTLTGRVNSGDQRRAAAKMVRELAGVRALNNLIDVVAG